LVDPPHPRASGEATSGHEYASRLRRLEEARWRRLLNVQAPYRWNIRRLGLGRTLDVGCGLGRNLGHLDGNGVGVDHNAESVAIAQSRGLRAFTPEAFLASDEAVPGSFDSLLLAHVLEHLSFDDGLALVRRYLPFLVERGRVCFITPQEAGYRTDPTHVRFVDFEKLRELSEALALGISQQTSFPFPRSVGRIFAYNEFVVVAERR
jgi:SAM-dependent methyltransferase